MAYHSYDNLKFVIFTNSSNAHRWNYLKETPYCFSDDKSIRFFATSSEEMQEVSNYLEKVLSKEYIKHPSDLFSVGDIVDCFVDSIDIGKEKVNLSLLER